MSDKTPPSDDAEAGSEETQITKWTSEKGAELEQQIGKPGFCDALAQSKDRLEFKALIQDVVRQMGFTDYGFLRTNNVDDMGGWLFTLPRELLETYHHNVYHEREDVWQYLVQENQPVYCADVYEWVGTAQFELRSIKASLAVYDLIKKFGYQDAYCMPLMSAAADHKVVFLVLARGMPVEDFKALIESCKDTLSLLGYAIDYVSTKHFPEFFIGSEETRMIAMTDASLEVLRTMEHFKFSAEETASELGISVNTVDKHLDAVMRELGANNVVDAIKVAKHRGVYYKQTKH